jgi:hypothetical protein
MRLKTRVTGRAAAVATSLDVILGAFGARSAFARVGSRKTSGASVLMHVLGASPSPHVHSPATMSGEQKTRACPWPYGCQGSCVPGSGRKEEQPLASTRTGVRCRRSCDGMAE